MDIPLSISVNEDLYVRYAKLVRVIDGDTVEVVIDLGHNITIKTKVRLAGLDTPSLSDPDMEIRARAIAAKGFVGDWMAMQKGDWPLVIRTFKPQQKNANDLYGRLLAVIENRQGENLNAVLLESGLATPFMIK